MFKKQNKHFVSEIDTFLHEFDQQHPERSESQLKEIKKHERLAHLRDEESRDENKEKLWEGF